MRTSWIAMVGLCVTLWCSMPGQASNGNLAEGDIPQVIEGFCLAQFPGAQSHFWVVNGTQWQSEHEVVVDVNTVVVKERKLPPVENRYLLLIVKGKLEASHSIPLDAKTDCEPETV